MYKCKMHATEAKMQKIEPDPKKKLMEESFGGSVQAWLTQHEVIFIF